MSDKHRLMLTEEECNALVRGDEVKRDGITVALARARVQRDIDALYGPQEDSNA